MKRFVWILATLISFILLCSCGNNSKRIVSEKPVKNEILGLKLCTVSSQEDIEWKVGMSLGQYVYTNNDNFDIRSVVRVVPSSLKVHYGELSWNNIDVTLNKDNRIVAISFDASYESIEMAKEHFEAAKNIFSKKYGKGNENKEDHVIFWTDDINSVGVSYEKSSTILGQDRYFCTLYYVNIELSEKLEESSIEEI